MSGWSCVPFFEKKIKKCWSYFRCTIPHIFNFDKFIEFVWNVLSHPWDHSDIYIIEPESRLTETVSVFLVEETRLEYRINWKTMSYFCSEDAWATRLSFAAFSEKSAARSRVSCVVMKITCPVFYVNQTANYIG